MFRRSNLTALTLILAIGLLAGCGRMALPGAARPGGYPGLAVRDDAAEPGGDAPPPAAAPTGGLKPLPRPTPTPAVPKTEPGPVDEEFERFYLDMRRFGYRGDRRMLGNAVRAVTHQYPMAWEPQVDKEKHFRWWGSTLQDFVSTYDEYAQQAVQLAQSRSDVIYYVWVSKQYPQQIGTDGAPIFTTGPDTVDFNRELPIVKGIHIDYRETPLVQISPRGTVLTFFGVATHLLYDKNHLVEIPRALY